MHPSNSFGIDHPLIAVNDIEQLRNRLSDLGFTMTPVGQHPWGTSTSLAIFKNCLLEIMGIYDETLIDVKPAGEFKFGRHVHEYLKKREGIALTALHSTDSIADAKRATASGWNVSGHLEFGRDVTLPNGDPDRTKTTLALMPDSKFPRLSFFLCQQHRRELVEVQEWMKHPNSVSTIKGIHIRATSTQREALRSKLEAIYMPASTRQDGFDIQTANGSIAVHSAEAIAKNLGPLPHSVLEDPEASIVGMDFYTYNLSTLSLYADRSGVAHTYNGECLILQDAESFGNTIFRFFENK